ncbi:hypothetical protein PSPO01_11553 [Paraphaeosphaeria sporulosa]
MTYLSDTDSDGYAHTYQNNFPITGSIKAHPRLWVFGACLEVLIVGCCGGWS